MIRLAAAAAIALAAADPAAATEWLSCSDRDGAASIDLLLGSMEIAAISGITVSAGEQVWASQVEYGPGDPVTLGQAFEDEGHLLVDIMDANMSARIAELRLFKASEGDGPSVYGGTLRIPGYGAWPVSCSGP